MSKSIIIYPLIYGLLIIAAIGCDEERNIDRIDWRREISNFINESLDGQELYSTDIYPQDIPFSMDDTDDLYFYRIDNISRSITIDSADLYQPPRPIYPFSYMRDVTASIVDDFEGSIYRIRQIDTTLAYKVESRLDRYAYFLKLYGDSYQYHGWRFWGYSTLGYSLDGVFTSDSGQTFTAMPVDSVIPGRLGRYYIHKNDIAKLPLGDSLTFSSDYQERIFAEDKDETVAAYNTLDDDGKNVTGWRIPLVSDKFYHLITFDSDTLGYHFRVDTLSADGDEIIIESTMVKQGDYVIPFKVDI